MKNFPTGLPQIGPPYSPFTGHDDNYCLPGGRKLCLQRQYVYTRHGKEYGAHGGKHSVLVAYCKQISLGRNF